MNTTTKRLGLIAAALTSALGLTGCNNALSGGATGAGLGALAGMGLGSLSGDMGKGAAAGAIIGAVGGAIIGDQNARASSRSYGGSTYYYTEPTTVYYERHYYSPRPVVIERRYYSGCDY
jgi:hypothetical protein